MKLILIFTAFFCLNLFASDKGFSYPNRPLEECAFKFLNDIETTGFFASMKWTGMVIGNRASYQEKIYIKKVPQGAILVYITTFPGKRPLSIRAYLFANSKDMDPILASIQSPLKAKSIRLFTNYHSLTPLFEAEDLQGASAGSLADGTQPKPEGYVDLGVPFDSYYEILPALNKLPSEDYLQNIKVVAELGNKLSSALHN